MSFLSFNEKYYADELERLEGRPLGREELLKVKRLLKLLDDLEEEGYPQLGAALERDRRAVSRLRGILRAHGEEPFPAKRPPAAAFSYSGAETDIDTLFADLCARAEWAEPSEDGFLLNIRDYCRWLGRQRDTAYVFLLRDTFLPYVYFRGQGPEGLYPWVINRDFLRQTAGEGADDALRRPVYEALEAGICDFPAFSAFCKPRIRAVLDGCPVLKAALTDLLRSVPEGRVVAVESGYCGTVPLALSALDERVDIRLYTTAPYLLEIYRDKIFCENFEHLRSFETLQSQDALMQYASLRDGKFYVRTASDPHVWTTAASELRALLEP